MLVLLRNHGTSVPPLPPWAYPAALYREPLAVACTEPDAVRYRESESAR